MKRQKAFPQEILDPVNALIAPAKADFLSLVPQAEELGYPKYGRVHGLGHIYRVFLLSLIYYYNAGDSLSPEDKNILIYFSLLHDIGRTNDWKDDSHGAKSVKKIEKESIEIKGLDLTGEDKKIASLAILCHSISDTVGEELIWNEMKEEPEPSRDRALKLYRICKDMDGLDRVRFGGLDARRLRTSYAKCMVGTATVIYHNRLARQLAVSHLQDGGKPSENTQDVYDKEDPKIKEEEIVLLGAIIGDFAGAPYESDKGANKAYLARLDFPLFAKTSRYTDDTVMTIAVCEAVMNGRNDPNLTRREVIKCMRLWGTKYPDAGYGGKFKDWLKEKDPEPYHSCGNGSAMRVSSVGWLYNTIEEVLEYAEITAAVSHDDPEGIKGAQSVAAAIFLARTGHSKAEIKQYIEENFHYDLNRTINEIRPDYRFDGTCQGSVPESIIAFLESESFEDAVRRAVSLDGDADTQGAIAGSIAEAFYGVPVDLQVQTRRKLPSDMRTVLLRFNKEKFPKAR